MIEWLIEVIKNPGSSPENTEHMEIDLLIKNGWVIRRGAGFEATKAARAFVRNNQS